MCGEEIVTLNDPKHEIFNLLRYQEPEQDEYEEFDLTDVFKVESQTPNTIPIDCPIHHIIVCEPTVPVCTNLTNLTTNETFIVNNSLTNGSFYIYVRRDIPFDTMQWMLTAVTESGKYFS